MLDHTIFLKEKKDKWITKYVIDGDFIVISFADGNDVKKPKTPENIEMCDKRIREQFSLMETKNIKYEKINRVFLLKAIAVLAFFITMPQSITSGNLFLSIIVSLATTGCLMLLNEDKKRKLKLKEDFEKHNFYYDNKDIISKGLKEESKRMKHEGKTAIEIYVENEDREIEVHEIPFNLNINNLDSVTKEELIALKGDLKIYQYCRFNEKSAEAKSAIEIEVEDVVRKILLNLNSVKKEDLIALKKDLEIEEKGNQFNLGKK